MYGIRKYLIYIYCADKQLSIFKNISDFIWEIHANPLDSKCIKGPMGYETGKKEKNTTRFNFNCFYKECMRARHTQAFSAERAMQKNSFCKILDIVSRLFKLQ